MNYIINERGESVMAVGSPDSPARMRLKYPDQMNNEFRRVKEVLEAGEGTGKHNIDIQFVGESEDYLAFEDAVWFFIKHPDH